MGVLSFPSPSSQHSLSRLAWDAASYGQVLATVMDEEPLFNLLAEAVMLEGFLMGITSIRLSGLDQSTLAKLKTMEGPSIASVSEDSEAAIGFQSAGIEAALRSGWRTAIDFATCGEATALSIEKLELAARALLSVNAQEKRRRGIAPFSLTVKGSK